MFYLQMNALEHTIKIIVLPSFSGHKFKPLSKCCVFKVCQYIIAEKQSITHYDDTKKMNPDSQIVRAKENFKLSYGGTTQRQDSGTNRRIKAFR